ncbi:hypothetical protein ACVBEH_26225, partial [Roseateles sp. GG27B]
QVLGITSASSHLFHRELANVLYHIQEGGKDKVLLKVFLDKAEQLDYAGIEPLQVVVDEVASYAKGLT